MSGLDWAVPLLLCPVCRGALELSTEPGGSDEGHLAHASATCDEVYPVIHGIPRLLVGPARGALVRDQAQWFRASPSRMAIAARWSGRAADDPVVRAFDAEWSRFDRVASRDLRAIFDLYFDLIPAELFAAGRTVVDAGCGAGRWAIEVAARGPRVLAIDLGRSVELARRNAGGSDQVACVQADLRALPLRADAVDWAYSLGVLHHIDAPLPVLRDIVAAVRPGGLVLLYLYYALDGRGFAYRALFRLVDAVRRVTSRSPRPLLAAISAAIALMVYWPLARSAAILERAGSRTLAEAIPLSFYRHRSLEIMRNDSLDRFGTSIEHRYTRGEMERFMRSAGLHSVRVSDGPPFWHAVGLREGRS